MKTLVTTVTERGQISIPAEIRRRMNLTSGQCILREMASPTKCRIRPQTTRQPVGAKAMLGYAANFCATKHTDEWMKELRQGESTFKRVYPW
ncbi:MAG: AbrB/MazE/SpoVT family DNA-binding domain-containing protein [Kiritimatiellae bacterium]|nr:AbrB/MazE/SpoVT family DNA-binding domain-containing protein [Kiritimatiellia bacterium]